MKKSETSHFEPPRGLRRRLISAAACLMAAAVLASGAWAAQPESGAQPAAATPSELSAPPAAATPSELTAPQSGVPLDATSFPDPAFLACVLAFDTDGSGTLSDTECAAVTRLDVRGKGITSLEGVGFFPELTYLNCIGNDIAQLPLEHLSNLTNLLCNENSLTSLDLSQTPALEVLHCHDNLLSSLDVSALPHLRELACGDNPFTSLDVSHNPELAYLLYLGGPLRTLTLSGNDALVDLWCSYSLVSELDLSQAPNLEILGVERSDLRCLDLSANAHLTEVMAADNLLLAVNAGQSIPNLDLSAQRAVEVQIAAEETSFDLARLGVPIDAACISDVTGAQLSGTVLTGISDGATVTYRYTDGAASFTATLLFRVSNAWLEPLTMEDWTYGEPAHAPHADAQYGQPTYLYSDSPDGAFTSDVPTDAGTWYVKATVAADADHAGLEAVQEFHILKAQPACTIPTDLSAVYGSTVGSIQPGTGFVWKTPAQLVGSVGTKSFAARFIPADTENYLTADGLEIPVRVTPKQASDSWVSAVTNAQDAACLTVRDGATTLREGVDYTLSTKESGGKVTITVTFLGNYTGTVLRSYTAPASSSQPSAQTGGQGSASAKPLPQKPPAPSSAASSSAAQSASSGEEQGKPLTSSSSSSRPEPAGSASAGSASSDAQTDSGTLIPRACIWWLLFLLLVLLLLAVLFLLLKNRRGPDDPDDTSEP